jgi:pyruvate,water dikinase
VETFVVVLQQVGRDDLVRAGGKGANLGELVRAGFPVPGGFVVTTTAYDGFLAHNRLGETIARALREEQGSGAGIRSAFEGGAIPPEIERDILAAYRKLGEGPVAVRSSATAEDLPGAAFAGQQDTFLNVSGEQEFLDAVRGCWASLWTDRAIAYRERQGIDQRTVKLAVVVQQMVEAEVAGVLFTADPLTGKRRRAGIDASPGLGEAVVSGMVNPDHFVVDTATGAIIERRLGDKRIALRVATGRSGTERFAPAGNSNEACLHDGQVRALAALGARVEAHYGAPQDTEWAIDSDGQIWLLQARPITTLFPLPSGAPATDDNLRVYFSASVAQGVYQPLTPMGLQTFRLVASAMATTLAGRPPRDLYAGPAFVAEAAGRLFLDITPLMRDKLWREALDLAMRNMEARTAPILQRLAADPRLSPAARRRWPVVPRTLLSLLVRARAPLRVPLRVAEALVRPQAAWDRSARVATGLRAAGEMPRDASAKERLAAVERVLLEAPPSVPLNVIPGLIAGLAANALAGRLLRDLATDDERRAVLRGLPGNPTTEMDLALWALAQEVRADPAAARTVRGTPPEQLAEDYLGGGDLPPKLRAGLAVFLRAYGHRGVAEIDLGLPRWSEDPTHILGVLANYLRLENPELAPDVQFRRAAREAEETATELTRRAGLENQVRGRLVGFFLGRARALLGMREMPKFCFILLFSRIRGLLWPVGEELANAGRLENEEDVFFVTLPEARVALGGADLRPVVRERRAAYAREMRRRHVPRVLLSDGTEPAAAGAHDAPVAAAEGVLSGTPASGGMVSAPARVILDPGAAVLEPGEILIAPSTDPGWTPLFLTAGGLVMEMGGPMSHGAIVAREYGIPAVVGVADATERIVTGQEITVDGSAGTIATRP